MIKLALVGKNISHSRSQEMYERLLGERINYSLLDYQKETDVKSLDDIFKENFRGISITYPYKKHFLNDVIFSEQSIKELDAINCIKHENDNYVATNTDYLAAKYLIEIETTKNPSQDYIVLGSGNMATVFSMVFNQLGITYKNFSRREHGDLNRIKYCEVISRKAVIVNCCSREFVFDSELPANSTFWDMNYSFEPHEKLKGAPFEYREGDDLLFYQAKFALQFWGIKDL